jgi:hypothetical protein
VTAGRKIEHHEEAYDHRLYRALAFRREAYYQCRKPDPDVPTLPLGSVVSKVSDNESGTG